MMTATPATQATPATPATQALGKATERRWVYFSLSILVSTCCAINYAFGVLTDTLKNDFNFSQTQVDFVGTCGNLGQYFGLIAGLMYDRYGPRLSLRVGAALILTGFGCLALALSGIIANPPLALVALFYFIGSHSQPWLDNAAVITNIHNFPKHIGLVVGLGKAFNGLGASIFSLIYSGAFSPNAAGYLFFLAVAPSAVSLVASLYAYRVSKEETALPCRTARLYLGYANTLLLMVYLSIVSIYAATVGFSSTAHVMTVVALLLFFIVYAYIPFGPVARQQGGTPVQTPLPQQYRKLSPNPESDSKLQVHTHIKQWEAGATEDTEDAEADDHEEAPLFGEMNVWQVLCKTDFWLIFCTATVIAGSGLSVINNISQLVESLNNGVEDSSQTTVFVTIIAMGSASGRLAVGIIASKWKPREKWQIILCFSSMLMTVSCTCLAWTKGVSSLYGTCLGIGISFGMLWAVIVPLCRDMYGSSGLAGVYSAVNFAPMVGSLALATYVTGGLYDHEKHAQGRTGEDTCVGTPCFQMAFIVLSGLGVCGTACSYILWCRCYACRNALRVHAAIGDHDRRGNGYSSSSSEDDFCSDEKQVVARGGSLSQVVGNDDLNIQA